MSDSTAVRRLAEQLVGLRRELRAWANAPRLGYSSFEGKITEYAPDGSTPVQVIGRQEDGTHTVAQLGGPVPPAPTTPIVEPRPGGLLVRWDGDFADGALPPMDFARVAVHASDDRFFVPNRASVVSSIETLAGAEVFLSLPPLEHHIRLVTYSGAGKPSDSTDQVSATPGRGGSAIRRGAAAPTASDAGVEGDLWWVVGPDGDVTEQWAWEGTAWAPRPISGTLIAAESIASDRIQSGAITAGKLESTLVLASEIIAGQRDGAHVSLRPSGFRAFAADPTDGEPNEVIRLGSSSPDFFAITRTDGTPMASIDQDGRATFQSVTVPDDMTVVGRPLVGPGLRQHLPTLGSVFARSWLDALPHGIVGWGSIITSSPLTNNNPGIGVFEIDVTLAAGRHYEVKTSPLRLVSEPDDADPLAEVRLVYTRTVGTLANPPALPPAPTVNSPVLARAITGIVDPLGHGTVIHGLIKPATQLAGIEDQPDRLYRYRILLTVLLPTPTVFPNMAVGVRAETQDPAQIWVMDAGPALPNGGQMSTGGGIAMTGQAPPPPPPVVAPPRNFTQEFGFTWMQSYRGNGLPYDNDGGHAYQGYGGSSFVGSARSMIGFPDLTGLLAGATVNSIEIYLYFSHWWYNSGGTAVIGFHGHASQPGTYGGTLENVIASGGWPKPGDRWLTITGNHYASFQGGAFRGITLAAPGGSLDKLYYGIATNSRIRVNYTK